MDSQSVNYLSPARNISAKERLGFLSTVGGVVIVASILGFGTVLALASTLGPIVIVIAGLELIVGIYLGYLGIKIEELKGSLGVTDHRLDSLDSTVNSIASSTLTKNNKPSSPNSYYSEKAMAVLMEKGQDAQNQSQAGRT